MSKANWKNRTLYISDNLPVLRGLNSESVDLIYLDPPFNSKREYKAPIGTPAEGQMFDDTWRWTDLDDRWLGEIERRNPALSAIIHAVRVAQGEGTAAYLTMMGIRLLELRRVLKPTGSIYLHCDPTASHYLKLSLDAVFGKGAFRNEIIWKRYIALYKGNQHTPKTWGNITATILFYANKQAVLNPYRPLTQAEFESQFKLTDEAGLPYYRYDAALFSTPNMGARPNLCYQWTPPDRPELSFENPHPSGWRLSKPRLDEEYAKGNIVITPEGKLSRRKYAHDFQGKRTGNLWDDIRPAMGKERTGWATQKPLALLTRIIRASSNPGDIVLDPFAGCATACVAAEMEGRQWIGIEACENATDIIQVRLDEADLGKLGGQADAWRKVAIERKPPRRTDPEGVALAEKRKTAAYKTDENFDELYGKQRGICNGCGEHFRWQGLAFDHIFPQVRGGRDDLDNLQLLCTHCNSTKGDGTMDDLRRRLKQQEEKMQAKREEIGRAWTP